MKCNYLTHLSNIKLDDIPPRWPILDMWGIFLYIQSKTYINGDDHHVLPQKCLHCNVRGHDLLNESPMRNIIRKTVCNKIVCKERNLFILKVMYDLYLEAQNIINTNGCWCSLHYACAIPTILTILKAMHRRHTDSITK